MKKYPLLCLIVSGTLLALVFAWIQKLSFQFEFADAFAQVQERPILLTIGLFGAAFVIYLMAIVCSTQLTTKSHKRYAFWTIVVSAITFRVILVSSIPIQEIDIYRYVWDGTVVANGQNPYQFSPLQIRNQQNTDDPRLLKLRKLRQRDEGLRELVDRIHFEDLPTIYPPVSQAVFALSAITTPAHSSSHARVVNMKAWLLLFDLLTLAAIVAMLRVCNRPINQCIIYAWCPLVMKEFANGGHVDSIAVFFSVAAVGLFLLGAKQATLSARTLILVFAGGALVLAIGAKIYPAVLLPCFFVASVRKIGWARSVAIQIGICLLSVLLLWPLVFGKPVELKTSNLDKGGFSETPVSNQTLSKEGQVEAVQPNAGLMRFASSFEINDWLFMLMIENLKPTQGVAKPNQAWFSIVPESIKKQLVQPLARRLNVVDHQAAYYLSRILTLLILASIVGWLCWKMDVEDSASIARVIFLSLAWFWLLSPTQNPWYWCWCLPFLPFAKLRTWYLLAGCVLIYYLRFWFMYQFPSQAVWPLDLMLPVDQISSIRLYTGDNFFNFVVTWLEFGPWFGLLLLEWIFRRKTVASESCN